MKEIRVAESFSDSRLDKYLIRLLPSASAGFIYKMLRKKNITLNGKKASGRELLRDGDLIRIFFSDETFEKFSRKEQICSSEGVMLAETDILYQDKDIMAVHKPAGLLSQSNRPGGDCLNARIISYLASEGELSSDFTPSIVNRLDAATSGIVLFGKTYHGVRLLTEMIRERRIVKTYKCICHKTFEEKVTVTSYLKELSGNRVSVTAERTDGSKRIITEFIPEKRLCGYTLLTVILHTGRKHQIRAQLAALGFPVAGDSKYGHDSGRLYLHAYSVEIPGIGQIVDLLPEEFGRFINAHL